MELYYLINETKYLDNYLLRQRLDLSKSTLQHFINHYQFDDSDIIKLQNKKLYSINSLKLFVENLLEKYGGE
ncbi:MAG TPA: hypothetical protein VK718_09230 [Ferruginibacter sp.]|jgi:hypothetical protein|nr:hypothetical protein [Ferruginibacter sp.]